MEASRRSSLSTLPETDEEQTVTSQRSLNSVAFDLAELSEKPEECLLCRFEPVTNSSKLGLCSVPKGMGKRGVDSQGDPLGGLFSGATRQLPDLPVRDARQTRTDHILYGRANMKANVCTRKNNPRKEQRQRNPESVESKRPHRSPAAKQHRPELVIEVKAVNNCKRQMNMEKMVWARRTICSWNQRPVFSELLCCR